MGEIIRENPDLESKFRVVDLCDDLVDCVESIQVCNRSEGFFGRQLRIARDVFEKSGEEQGPLSAIPDWALGSPSQSVIDPSLEAGAVLEIDDPSDIGVFQSRISDLHRCERF